MAVYCIGDIHGCYAAFELLLNKIAFSPSRDNLYILGDMVNRGENSLGVLRKLKDLDGSAQCVLGNHDLHLLAVAYTNRSTGRNDTIRQILNAPDCEQLLTWLRQQKLAIYANSVLMVHAGVLAKWKLSKVLKYAGEVQDILRGPDFIELFNNMYGNSPTIWSKRLEDWDRLRIIINALTRMRYCTVAGEMDFKNYGSLDNNQTELIPWFDVPNRKTSAIKVAFGHWSTLGWQQRKDIYALDTGCVWGGKLSALELDQQGNKLNLIQVTNPYPIKPSRK